MYTVLNSCFRDFDGGTTGLASTGAVCRAENNTGFITLLNHGRDRNMEESIVTLAHELGHSLGAAHDDEVKYFCNQVQSKYFL